MYFLGITAYAHDSAAALLKDSQILGFVEEERFNREKHTSAFPERCIRHLLETNGLDIRDIDEVAFYFRPWQLIARRTLRALRYLPRSLVQFFTYRPGNAWKMLNVDAEIRRRFAGPGAPPRYRFRRVEHHLAHAASAFYLSGFEDAAVFSVDGAGEDITTWFGHARGSRLERRHCIRLPHSLGLFYSAVTDYLGFKPWGGEGKVMGLAAYGDPDRYYEPMRRLLRWSEEGELRVELEYFDYHVTGWTRWVSPRFEAELGPRRVPESEIEQRHADLAAALQRVTEEAALALVHYLHRVAPSRNLCMAGGLALNSVMNGRIEREGPFENIFIQPASNDAGTALGGALFLACAGHGLPLPGRVETVCLGPEYTAEQCRAALQGTGLRVDEPRDVAERVASLLAQGKIVGWFQGRMEAGPRALGHRSILADPRDPAMKDTLNLKVKRREPFRPFAPSVLAERAGEYFVGIRESPHMLLVYPVAPEKRSEVPAITHVDGTARVQTVRRDFDPTYYRLIESFARQTGVPLVLNTSFNVRGEPIVCSPHEAVRCFQDTRMDYLALGPCLASKA